MSDDAPVHDIAKTRVIHAIPGTDNVRVERDLEFPGADSGALAMDLYRPDDAESGSRTPVVILIAGYPDGGFQRKPRRRAARLRSRAR